MMDMDALWMQLREAEAAMDSDDAIRVRTRMQERQQVIDRLTAEHVADQQHVAALGLAVAAKREAIRLAILNSEGQAAKASGGPAIAWPDQTALKLTS